MRSGGVCGVCGAFVSGVRVLGCDGNGWVACGIRSVSEKEGWRDSNLLES